MKQGALALTHDMKQPLAERLRPTSYDKVIGLKEQHPQLISELERNKNTPPSMIFWGPPGSGKTTLARIIMNNFEGDKSTLSAVSASSKEIVKINEEALQRGRPTLLFVDEVHRFNKSQQDVLLPGVEHGSLILIGATTENPSFSLNRALLSRTRLVKLRGFDASELHNVVRSALDTLEIQLEEELLQIIATAAGGDARRALMLVDRVHNEFNGPITKEQLTQWLKSQEILASDKSSDYHYGLISAFIKSMRAGQVDAALFYAFRMIEAGEDPRYILRRMMIFAAEDIGNADPRALQLAVATSDAYEKIGLPEGKIPISQCIVYLSKTKKSRTAYDALRNVEAAIRSSSQISVPGALLNNETSFASNEELNDYLPVELRGSKFYFGA